MMLFCSHASWKVLAALFCVALAALPARAATIAGTLASAGVVWVSGGGTLPPGPEQAMHQTNKTFVPDLLVVAAGGTVRFPNDDPFYHSVYSASTADPFDIGFYDTGPGKTVTFASPGVVAVTCHIHAVMHATIVVVDGPWARTEADGAAFTLANVRPGTHDLHVWSAAAGERIVTVRLERVSTRLLLAHAL